MSKWRAYLHLVPIPLDRLNHIGVRLRIRVEYSDASVHILEAKDEHTDEICAPDYS